MPGAKGDSAFEPDLLFWVLATLVDVDASINGCGEGNPGPFVIKVGDRTRRLALSFKFFAERFQIPLTTLQGAVTLSGS